MAYSKEWNGDFMAVIHKYALRGFDLCIEVGCFEGLTSNYIVNKMLSSEGKLICIDPLHDGYYYSGKSAEEDRQNDAQYKYFNGQYERFAENCHDAMVSGRLELIRQDSVEALPALLLIGRGLADFIYVDGDHRQYMVFHDSIFSFQLLKVGGYLFLDDYGWSEGTTHAIDFFLDLYKNKLEVVHHADGNVIVRKIR